MQRLKFKTGDKVWYISHNGSRLSSGVVTGRKDRLYRVRSHPLDGVILIKNPMTLEEAVAWRLKQ